MLGEMVEDPDGVEEGGALRGMELLPVKTELKKQKKRCQVEGKIGTLPGIFSELSGCSYQGYEIHMGSTHIEGEASEEWKAPVYGTRQNMYGSYIHGLFDQGYTAEAVDRALAKKKGLSRMEGKIQDYRRFKETQYDKLADAMRMYFHMEEIYGMLREARL